MSVYVCSVSASVCVFVGVFVGVCAGICESNANTSHFSKQNNLSSTN